MYIYSIINMSCGMYMQDDPIYPVLIIIILAVDLYDVHILNSTGEWTI